MPNGDYSFKNLIPLIIVASVFGTGSSYLREVVDPVRDDPFRGNQAIALEERSKAFTAAAIALHDAQIKLVIEKTEASIRADMPPAETKRRIRAIETYIQQQDPSWSPPIYSWSND